MTTGHRIGQAVRRGMFDLSVVMDFGLATSSRPGMTDTHKIACGTNRELLPVIGLSSSRIESPHGS